MKVPVLLALALSIIALNGAEARPGGRIINGKDAFYSYVASLLTERDGLFVRGGGSFLTQSAILTSGSMIHGSSLWYVNYGNESIFYTEQAVATRAVVPPYFNPETLENDIGIVFLDSPADPAKVQPIPIAYQWLPPYVNEQGRLVSFSLEQRGTEWVRVEHMQAGYLRRIENSTCDELLAGNGITVTETTFCAMDDENYSSACYGDYGSGFTVYIEDVSYLVGVVSIFTNKCHPSFPTVFTKISPYYYWIYENVYGGTGTTSSYATI